MGLAGRFRRVRSCGLLRCGQLVQSGDDVFAAGNADEPGDDSGIRADEDAPPGDSGRIELTISDGDAEVTGSVAVRVIGSDAPLATVGADVAETFQGRPVEIRPRDV